MKYKTFARLRTLGIVGVVVAGIFGISQCNSGDTPEQALPRETQTRQIPQQTQATPSGATVQYGADILPKTTADDVIFKTQMEPTSLGKPDDKNGGLKRTVRKNGLKMYLKSDTHKGYDYWNRVKVDYQDNGKWDEQWIFSKNGAVRREVSQKEDENFDMIYTLEGAHWVLKK
ncbi:MAG TPA: hypothetical protein VEC36_07430 [Patescibacteria group bacterium]|nr:hypothetical protein [Patescibacteria group bacterium]